MHTPMKFFYDRALREHQGLSRVSHFFNILFSFVGAEPQQLSQLKDRVGRVGI